MNAVKYPIGKVDPALTGMDLKCVVVKPILRYLECEVGKEELFRIIADTKMSIDHLEGAENWISFNYFAGLLERVIEVTGDPMAPFKACQRFTDRESYQGLRTFLRHVGSPRESYRLLFRSSSLWNRISEWKVLSIGKTECRIEVRFTGVIQTRANCLAIQGGLTALPRDYGLPNAEVTEESCACNGAQACRYRIVWKDRARHLFAIAGCGVGVLAGLTVGTLAGSGLALSVMIGGTVGLCIGWAVDGRREIDDICEEAESQAQALWRSIREREVLAERLQSQVVERTAELKAANDELSRTMEDLKATRERELQAERQATMGVVAGGMAHELNSPLNAVRLSLQELGEELPRESSLLEPVARAERASGRCKRIINDLLVCCREPRRDVILQLRDIVRDTVHLYEREHPNEIRIVRRFEDDLPGVALDQIQMQHVVTNLLKNASDAMDGRGEVEVALSWEAERIVLRVSDRGPGVSEAEKERIFQPLHSTKGGRGLGLGLSITRQLVWRNNGTITVSDREGGGSVFTVRFPVHAESHGDGAVPQGAP